MLIKIDNREHELVKHIRSLVGMLPLYHGIQIEVLPLPLGDIILSIDGMDKWIVERKSLADLAASIKDGRYEEQSYRLNGLAHPNHNIVYLVEGDVNRIPVNQFKHKIDKLTLFSAMFSLSYYKGFSVFRTMHVEETALFLCHSLCKMARDTERKPFYNMEPVTTASITAITAVTAVTEGDSSSSSSSSSSNNNLPDEKDYVEVVKRVKKENITPQNIDEIILCQLPGISSVTALAIVKRFGSIAQLIAEGKKDPACLHSLSYVTEKGVTRKISKTCVQHLLDFLINK